MNETEAEQVQEAVTLGRALGMLCINCGQVLPSTSARPPHMFEVGDTEIDRLVITSAPRINAGILPEHGCRKQEER